MLTNLPTEIAFVVVSSRETASFYTREQVSFAAVQTDAEAKAIHRTFVELAGQGVQVVTYSRVGYMTAVVDGRLI